MIHQQSLGELLASVALIQDEDIITVLCIRLKDLGDMTTRQTLDDMYKSNLLSPDSGNNGGEVRNLLIG